MIIKDRIVACLRIHPEGLDDDELTKILNLSARQTANINCRRLQDEGVIERREVNGKLHNFLVGEPVVKQISQIEERTSSKYEDWFWEGNVQSDIVKFLVSQGCQIRSVADTASHQRGIDIMAEQNGKNLWVSVKGYPRGTAKTRASVQAGHWFKHAIFDIIEYRERDKDALLVVAFPDYPRYRKLAKMISWLQSAADFKYYWLKETGEISVE
ncbi:MAG: hypothetical protein RBT34_04700 [Anaerolineaceae bacterium]|jgi:hypothetical protein|nr:hypothetical protein [Anaerolineaceae bacterium]